ADSSGNVGIGTSTPSNKLTVNGNADFTGNVGVGTAAPGEKLTVAGSMEVGVNSADYQHLRVGGGNSNGFIYGSYPGLGDGIHMGYNWYADAAGAGHQINAGGGTSRITVGYGSIAFATGGPTPINHITLNGFGYLDSDNGCHFPYAYFGNGPWAPTFVE